MYRLYIPFHTYNEPYIYEALYKIQELLLLSYHCFEQEWAKDMFCFILYTCLFLRAVDLCKLPQAQVVLIRVAIFEINGAHYTASLL